MATSATPKSVKEQLSILAAEAAAPSADGKKKTAPAKKAKSKTPTAPAAGPISASAFQDAFEEAKPKPPDDSAETGPKIAYATRLSNRIANVIRDGLAAKYPNPFAAAKAGEESYGGDKAKKIDVLFATTRLGLALDVSIKTQSFAGFETKKVGGKPVKAIRATKAYAHNPTRIIDQELAVEARRCHQLSPRAVMIAVLFFPADACIDANERWADKQKRTPSDCSSVAEFALRLRNMTNRDDVRDPDQEAHFEAIYIAVHGLRSDVKTKERQGEPLFFDVSKPLRRYGLPDEVLDFDGFLAAVKAKYDERFGTKREFHEFD